MNVDLMDPKEQMVCGSRFIVSLAGGKCHEEEIAPSRCTIALTSIKNLAGGKYHEEEIAPSRCTIALTSIKNLISKVPFPSKLPSRFMKGLTTML